MFAHICHSEQNPTKTAVLFPLFCFLSNWTRYGGQRKWGTTCLSWCFVDLPAVSLQGPWAKHLVRWPMPSQSLNLQERWLHQKMRRRKRPWRPCSPVWPHSAARAAQPGPQALLRPCHQARTPWSLRRFLYLLHYTSGWGTAFWRMFSANLSSLSAEVWGSQWNCFERQCNKCIIFRGINRSIFWGMRAKKCIFSRSTSENRVDCLNVEDSVYFFFVCKTLYKWILINFCFNIWSHCRLLGAVNFQGVCFPNYFICWPWKEEVL